MSEYEREDAIRLWGQLFPGQTNREARDAWVDGYLYRGAAMLPTPPAPDADPKPDAVAKKRPRKDASAVLREIEDFLGHIAMNGADAKDREVALALEQDAHVLAAKPDAVCAAFERVRGQVATAAGMATHQHERAVFEQVSAWFMQALATEQAEREGGGDV